MATISSDLRQYGVPFYGAGWVPYNHVRSKLTSQEKIEEDNKEDKDPTQSKDDEISTSLNYVVLAGGGGEGRSGIPNAVVVSHVDFASNSLSHQPVVMLRTGSDLPYRMTVHPRGDGIICALQQSCSGSASLDGGARLQQMQMRALLNGYPRDYYGKVASPAIICTCASHTLPSTHNMLVLYGYILFEWEELEGNEVHKLSVKVSEKVLTQLKDVGQQLALTFNSEGSELAVGGEDGSLRVFKWPSMEIILNEAQAHSSIKDLDFSCDGKFLISLGSGLCRIWDVTSSKVVASLAKGNDEIFAFCRFSQINDRNPVLYIAVVTDHGGSILTWNTSTWKRMRSKRVVREAISAFNVSADGKFLAVGTVGGDLFIINSYNMRVQMTVKKAHLGLVTALTFSHDSRALISASLDSSARVTLVKDTKKSGGISWLIVFMVLVAIAVYFMKEKGIIP